MTPAARRDAVAYIRETYEMSERRACSTANADRTMIRYRSKRPDDAPLRKRMVELAHERRRFGYRRLHVILKSEGLVVNRKKTERLYREEGLKVRRRRGRRRAIGTRAPIPMASEPNVRWSLDFVHDQISCGRRFGYRPNGSAISVWAWESDAGDGSNAYEVDGAALMG